MENAEYELGLVKWFGGKTREGKQNNFGFLQSMNGEDIYIHKQDIISNNLLNPDDVVIFEIAEEKGKKLAKKLYCEGDPGGVSINIFLTYLKNKKNYPNFFNSSNFKKGLVRFFNNHLNEENLEFIHVVKEEIQNDINILEILKESKDWEKLFPLLIQCGEIDTHLKNGFPLHLFPSGYIKKHENILYYYIEGLTEIERDKYLIANLSKIPTTVFLVGIVKKIIINEDLISSKYEEINEIIENKFRERDQQLPEYVNATFSSSFKNSNDYLSNTTIWKMLEPLLLKKKIYDRKNNIENFFYNSRHLKNKIDYFILTNLFSLIQAKNSIDVVYKIFLHRLWEALTKEDIEINDDALFNLFPQCNTMAHYSSSLSCEAVYWPKNKIYLCRGKECKSPKVKPNNSKHYLDFNIYDWFEYYGINYFDEDTPAKERDFPIKLAGYFNRLKEIFNILHCRSCKNLMKPDMKYARVEYIEYVSEKPVKRSMAAAYRATVFECGLLGCDRHNQKHYINHCVGFGCNKIIDSRDLKVKCDRGLYICRGCGGCCADHGKTNYIGSCPDCGSKLDLFERQTSHHHSNSHRRFNNGERTVKCSNHQCDFKITENIPKKFYLATCLPVRKINN